MRSSILLFALSLACFVPLARAQEVAAPAQAAATVPYQKLVGETFVKDLDGQPVTLRVVYDGVSGPNIVTLYRNSKIKTKDRVFVNHHDPATPAIPSGMVGVSAMPSFAISFAKADADRVLALAPGTVIEISGVAEKTVFGMMAVKTLGLHVNVSAFQVVDP